MIIEKEVLTDFKENYEKVRKLLDEDSKHDPANEPYLSKYAARAILVHMKHTLTCMVANDNTENRVHLQAMLAATLLNIGIIGMDTEELSAGEKALAEAVELLQEQRLVPEAVVTLVTTYNQLGVLWSGRDNTLDTKKYLLLAKDLYEEFKQGDKTPISIDRLFDGFVEEPSEGTLALEKAHTLTLYYLAQLYGALKENLKSAVYCHITLKRQLEYGDYDPIDWALNAATLSQFFAEQDGFLQSRHHLAAASTVLRTCELSLLAEEVQDEAHDARAEQLKHRSADVARCWVKYCLMLLSSSKRRLMADSEVLSGVTDLSNLNIDDDENLTGTALSNMFFSNINVTDFENKITADFLLIFDDARKVFLECQSWLNKAKEYYQLNTLASDYIEIVQDNSQAYSHLLFFEEDDDRQAKMHKRRINMLEELIKEINPTYYLQYCRQLWYELGEIYSDILNLKLDKLKSSSERPTPHMLNKINTLSEQSIIHFEHFLKSVRETASGQLPSKLEPDTVRPVITAYALIARNHMKIIAPDKNVELQNYTKAWEAFKSVVDYCKGDEDAAIVMREELSLCEEMVTILPLKIKKIESEITAA